MFSVLRVLSLHAVLPVVIVLRNIELQVYFVVVYRTCDDTDGLYFPRVVAVESADSIFAVKAFVHISV